ncbi:MAG: fatty acid desaturase [Rhodospirillales bacterium]
MEDFVARTDLIPRDDLRALSRRSDGPALLHLASHLGALALSGTAITFAAGTWWLAPAMLVHGVLLVFLFTSHHECIHGTAFRTRWLNDAANWVFAVLLAYPRTWFRCFHFAHHRYTQDPARDPELLQAMPATRAAFAWWATGLPYWYGKLRLILRIAATAKVQPAFVPPAQKPAVVRECRIILACWAGVAALAAATDPLAPLLYWIGPALLGQPFLRLYLNAEHGGCAYTGDMLQNARTTLAGPVVRWLAWNMPYHTEHHVFPAVPYHALPAVHARMRDRLRVTAPSHAAVNRDLWRALPAAPATAEVSDGRSG